MYSKELRSRIATVCKAVERDQQRINEGKLVDGKVGKSGQWACK